MKYMIPMRLWSSVVIQLQMPVGAWCGPVMGRKSSWLGTWRLGRGVSWRASPERLRRKGQRRLER
jgi:hypothetical protein